MTDDKNAEQGKQKPSKGLKTVAVLLVITAIVMVGYQLYKTYGYLEFDPAIVRHDGDTLYIVAFGNVRPDAIDVAKQNIEREYPELGSMKAIALNIPEDARIDIGEGNLKPLSAERLLKAMAESTDKMPGMLKAMGVIEEPLYFEEVGSEYDIWGLTDAVGGNFGVVSTTYKRIDIEKDGSKPGTKEYAHSFDLSLGKSVLHEFGHLMGLNHCKGGMGCPMEILSPISALEERGNVLCDKHRAQLRRLYKLWGLDPAI
jgi:predicted Zn-dependent protease